MYWENSVFCPPLKEIGIWGKIRMVIQSKVNFCIDKIKGLSPNHVLVQKSSWPYSMQTKFWMDKIQKSYKVGVVIMYYSDQDIFSHYLK